MCAVVATHLENVPDEVWVLVGPVRATNERDDLHELVTDESWHRAMVGEQVRAEELTELHPLGGVNRRPLVRHQILQEQREIEKNHKRVNNVCMYL